MSTRAAITHTGESETDLHGLWMRPWHLVNSLQILLRPQDADHITDAPREYIEFDSFKLLERLWPDGLVSSEHKTPAPVTGTSSWFLAHPSYEAWLENNESGLLWLTGKPGSGKSTLTKFLARNLRGNAHDGTDMSPQYRRKQSSAIVCSYFFDYTAPPRSSELILRSLVHQVLTRQPSLMQFVPASVKQHHYWTDDLDISLSATLHHLSSHNKIYCIIDGLDECHGVVQSNLIDALCQLGQSRRLDQPKVSTVNNCSEPTIPTQLKILISSRSDVRFYEDLKCQRIDLSLGDAAKGLQQDAWVILGNRLRLSLSEIPEVLMPVLDQLASKQNTAGILLWVQAVLRVLFAEYKGLQKSVENDSAVLLGNNSGRRVLVEEIARFPKQLSSLYQSMLDRLDDRNKSTAHQALRWILVAQRPLTLGELGDILMPQSSRQSRESADYLIQEILHKRLGGLI